MFSYIVPPSRIRAYLKISSCVYVQYSPYQPGEFIITVIKSFELLRFKLEYSTKLKETICCVKRAIIIIVLQIRKSWHILLHEILVIFQSCIIVSTEPVKYSTVDQFGEVVHLVHSIISIYHEFHESGHSVTFIVLVNSHQR